MIELLLEAERARIAGELDRAERLFRSVAESDPQNAIADVGLARIAAARGDLAGAGALARRALVIDPENPAAAHLLAGLRGPETGVPPPTQQSAAEPASPRGLWGRLRALLGLRS